MESELDRILADLYRRNKRLAKQLLEKQIISVEELDKLLGNEQIPLGQLLLDEKLILQYELKIALLEQQLNSKKLGEILVEQQAISSEQLTKVLHKQAWQIEKSKMSKINN